MKYKTSFLGGVGPLLSALVGAQTPPATTLEEVIVTATRTAQPVATTLAQTYVIGRDQIEAAGGVSLAELLQRHAGVEIRTSGPGQPSGLFMRGANSAHTLVLVDGLRIGSATSGTAALENIALDLIERIEVVKGPLSSLYGADAIGGVVQIFTRNADRSRLAAAAGFGSHSTLVFNGGFSAVEGKTNLTVDAGYRRIAAPSTSNTQAGSYVYHPDHDPYNASHALIKLSHTLWQGEKLSLSAWQSRSKAKFDAGPADDDASNHQTLSAIEVGSENKILPWWYSSLKIGRTTDESIVNSDFGGNFRTQQNQADWQNELTIPTGKLMLGYAWLDQRVASSIGYTQNRRTTQSIYASLAEQRDSQYLHASVRRDQDDQYGKRHSGSFSYGINFWSDELVYASYGKGFHTPSFNDLYYPGFSNPSLRPEKSKTTELGYRLTRRDYRFNLAVFDNQIDDLIVYNAAIAKPENVRRAHIRGWEVSSQLNWAGILIKGTLTAQKPEDADTRLQLQSRSKQFGSLAISTTQGKWNIGVDMTASARRYDSASQAATSIMGGYALLGAYVKYSVDKSWTVELTGTNLTDRAYELIKGYDPPGRYLLLNVKFAAF